MPEEGNLIYSKADMPKKQRNKNYQAGNIKGSKKPKKVMWSEKPAIISRNKNPINKNCQADKNSVMQSVTNTEDRHSAKPEIRRLCRDKNCQSTRCYKNMSIL